MKLASEGKRIKSYIHILDKDMLSDQVEMTSSTSLVTLFFQIKCNSPSSPLVIIMAPLAAAGSTMFVPSLLKALPALNARRMSAIVVVIVVQKCTLHATRHQGFKLRLSTHPPCTMTLLVGVLRLRPATSLRMHCGRNSSSSKDSVFAVLLRD